MNLAEVTIIIPTHNRNILLERAINYYSDFNCKIIITDSSDLQNFNFLNKSNIIYFYFHNTSFAKKLYYAITHVKTKYVCLSADDDFLSINGLNEGVIFLEKNDDYFSVQGKYVHFYTNKNNFTTLNLYETAGLIHYNSESPFQRVVDSSKNGMQLLYALHRTESLLNSFKVSEECMPLTMVEYTSNLIPLFYGKHKMLNIFWMARDPARYTTYESKSNSTTSVLSPLDLINYFNTQNGIDYRNMFILKFIEVTNSNLNESNKLFYEVFFQNYIQIHLKKLLNRKDVSFYIKVKTHLKLNAPILKYVYSLYDFLNRIFSSKKKYIFPFKENENEWFLIKSIIIKYSSQLEKFKI
jgi:glycosyltransferase domain-containing protein